MIQPVLKYPGAKWSIAKWILGFIPEHDVYLEPFFGSGAVFFNKRPARIETINDIGSDVVNLFRVIRTKTDELAALIEMTPWARDEYLESYYKTGDELEDARRFLVRCWQAYGTRTGGGTGWRSDVHGRKQRDGFPGRIVAVGIPPDMEGIVRKQTCTCGAIKGKKTILNSHAIVGVTTEFQDNEVFKNNKGLYLENNYCPQCGTPYEIVEDGQKKLFLGEESA